MDTSAYNMPPVKAAQARLILAQRAQRFAYQSLDLLRAHAQDPNQVPSHLRAWSNWVKASCSTEQLQQMQARAFADMHQAMHMLTWCEMQGIEDTPLTDEQSLKLRAEQRAQVESEYLKHLASNP